MIKTKFIIIISLISILIITIGIGVYLVLIKNSFQIKEKNFDNYCDYFVTKLRIEQKNIKVDYLKDSVKVDFDIKDYLQIFDELAIEKGWKVEFYYFYNGDAGRPLFLALQDDTSLKDLLNSFNDKYEIFRYNDSVNVFNHIKVSGTEKSYYQILILNLLGDDFALFWHAGYGSLDLLTSKRAVDNLKSIRNGKDFDKIKDAISKIDTKPIYKTTSDSVMITLKCFNDWSGLSERTYSIRTKFPHKINLINDSILIKYNCGILF